MFEFAYQCWPVLMFWLQKEKFAEWFKGYDFKWLKQTSQSKPNHNENLDVPELVKRILTISL